MRGMMIVNRITIDSPPSIHHSPVHPLPHVHAMRDMPIKARVDEGELARPHVVQRYLRAVAQAPLPFSAGVHEIRVGVVFGFDAVRWEPGVQYNVEFTA